MTQTPHTILATTEESDPTLPALVVATADLEQVTKEFGDLGLRLARTEGPLTLGLTRLTLRDASDGPIDELDGLLAEVRRRISAAHGGLVPPMGKDREASSTLAMMRGGNPKPTGLAPEKLDAGEFAALAVMPGVGEAPGVRIGLVDTTHVPWNTPPEDVQAWQGHAGFVIGIVESTASGAEVIHRPALSEGGGRGTGWTVASAIVELAALEPDILLLPLACFTADGQPPLLIERAIAAVPASTLIIAAAGNQTLDAGWSALGRGPANPAWPAALPRVKAVGVDPAEIVELAAPPTLGVPPWVDAVTTELEFVGEFFTGEVDVAKDERVDFAGHAKWRGTSFCAAYAAGLVAARMSGSGLTAIEAWNALLDDAGSPLGRPVRKQ